MKTRLVPFITAGLLFAATGASAAVPSRATTHVYDVQVTGSVTTRDVNQGVPTGAGTVDMSMRYELAFGRVAVRVNPLRPAVRVVATATRAGTGSGRFTFNSRVAGNVCAGAFDFRNLTAKLTLNASGPRGRAPHFRLSTVFTKTALNTLLVRVEQAKSTCPQTRPDGPYAPSLPVPAGPGITASFFALGGAIFTRETWVPSSAPLAQLLAGRSFKVDTGVRAQQGPDACEPGSCIRRMTARTQVTFAPVR